MRILQRILKGIFSLVWLVLVTAMKLLCLFLQMIFCMAVLALKVFCVTLHAASFD